MTKDESFSKSFVQPLEPVESTPEVESISIDFLTNLSLLTTPTPTFDVFNDGKCGGGDPADDDDADDDPDDDDAHDVVDDDARF